MSGRVPAQGPADWPALRVVVVGIGLSGAAAARQLARLGSSVLAVDDGDGPRQQEAADALTEAGVEVQLGRVPNELPAGADLVVTSPGVRPTTPLFAAASAAGVPVWGEVELAWRLGSSPWLAVTGTNGKTTTTQMLGAILVAAGRRVAVAGNIGTPLLDAVTADPPPEVLAVELSSFQLYYTSTVCPQHAAVLNLAEDHLDWHGSMHAYAEAKAKVICPRPGSCFVYNGDDPLVTALAARASCVHPFTLGPPSPGGLGVLDGVLIDRAFPHDQSDVAAGIPLLAVDELPVPGPHNVANALAAAGLARTYGVAPEAVAAGLRSFAPDAHRNQLVASVDGVGFVDDSKATNPHAAAASLAAYPSVVWIAGGLNKGAAFDELVRSASARLRAAVLIGSCAEELAGALARHAPQIPVERAVSMDDAVVQAARRARPGDTVLLAPAAASMDMFVNYAARGDAFTGAAQRWAASRKGRQ